MRARLQVLSNTIKEKRKQKAGKWSVPLPKVAPITEDEMFKVIKTGKRKSASGCPLARCRVPGGSAHSLHSPPPPPTAQRKNGNGWSRK